MIRSRLCRFVIVVSSALCAAAAGAAEPGKPGGAAKPATAPAAVDDISNTIVPELSVQGVQLRDMIEFLQDAVPGFKAVVFRDPGVAEDEPVLNIRLKRVSIEQVLTLLTTAYPNLELNEIPGAGGTIYCIKVHSPAAVAAALAGVGAGGAAAQPGGGGGVAMIGEGGGGAVNPAFAGWAAAPAAEVRVYPLADTVTGLIEHRNAAGGDKGAAMTKKDALNQVLSLVKATMAQVSDGGGGAGPVLQVHEETQTLIFKGTPAQRGALESVLAALPRAQHTPEDVSRMEDRFRSELDRRAQQEAMAREDLSMAHKKLLEQQDEVLKLTTELERMKVRMEEMERLKQQQKTEGK